MTDSTTPPRAEPTHRSVRVLINPRSGVLRSLVSVQEAIDRFWDEPTTDLVYQTTHSPEDGRNKALRAVEMGIDTMIVVGGDGTINSIGNCLIGSHTALTTIPMGSGNGFARHFGVPLRVFDAAEALSKGYRTRIDVGKVNGHSFFITCSLAWDAAIAQGFQQFPVRGILPYVFAGAYTLLDYRPQPIDAEIDGVWHHFEKPLVFTVANLTQYGGGAVIAPNAKPDDGLLELVVVENDNIARLVANLPHLWQGTLDDVEQVKKWRFKTLKVRRRRPDPIQIDGELLKAGADLEITVAPRCLDIIAPGEPEL
ncbi:MAG: YegS/Rv2252/BmrU family lipid kinase [Verrucomicrobiota bacterium]|jgi:diacylglycerol kinase (ATP)|nr:YegS/Rv2252/BmrU family lipid kinase [Verrucomicrobiota bacterium]